MIYVERSSVPEPPVFRSKRVATLRARAREFYDPTGSRLELKGAKHSPPGTFKWYTGWYNKMRQPLQDVFYGKCAYCESQISMTQVGDVALFRPRHRAMQLDGRIDEGYWWLAHEWWNFYFTCRRCNAYKANRFPVDGRRARGLDELDKEKALSRLVKSTDYP